MKNFSFSLLVIILFFTHACSVDGNTRRESPDNISLGGRWKLIERLVDPGDGSGALEPVEDGPVLHISTAHSFIQSDDEFCGTTDPVEVEISDDYFEMDCNQQNFKWFYEFEEELLVIKPQCFEGCLYKYRKIEEEKPGSTIPKPL